MPITLTESDLEALAKLMAVDPKLGSRITELLAAKQSGTQPSPVDIDGLRNEIRALSGGGMFVMVLAFILVIVGSALFVSAAPISVRDVGMVLGGGFTAGVFCFGAVMRISATTFRSYLSSDEPEEKA